MILVDTSVWIDFFNSSQGPAGNEMERLIRSNAPLALTGLVVVEVLQGLRRDIDPVADLLARWPLIEPGGFTTYAEAARISRQARARGATVSTVDTLIAAVALEFGATLFTLDQDFRQLAFTGLQVY